MIRIVLQLMIVMALAMCRTATGPASTVKVYKHDGSLQCMGGGTPPEIMKLELTSAGIAVRSYGCGNTGAVYITLCGVPGGSINIFEIPVHQLAKAEALGFYSLSRLPKATEFPCP